MSTLAEERAVAGGRGKWSHKGVPHKGWTCIDVEDRGVPDWICEMCETQSIRFVHYMEHRDYDQILGVGCVCAGNLEESVARARERDDQMRSRAGKRSRWLARKWKVSMKGNDWIEDEGYRITVYAKDGGWGATVATDGFVHHARGVYTTPARAKLAAFDLVTTLLSGKV